MPVLLGLGMVFALSAIPYTAAAAVVINEVAWPNTIFTIALFCTWVLVLLRAGRAGGSQKWCLGKIGLGIFFLCIPAWSHAAVLINEIAWMGTTVSANDEWIELYNNGESAVSLEGWVLTDNVTLDVVLTGTLPGGGYGVLERTDDASAPGAAFLVYTGALANEGRTLTLLNAEGRVADQVAGGENWETIGGDNATKDTAQRSAAGWRTAVPTPGRQNVTAKTAVPKPTPSVKMQTEVPHTSSAPRNDRISLVLPDTELTLIIDAPTTVYVSQEIPFVVSPTGISEQLVDSLSYQWNFGDGSKVVAGEQVAHFYQYPGQYVVVVSGTYARHDAVARHTVTVLPRALSLARAADGALYVHNDARYEIDLSGYRLVGDREVVLPQHTILLPAATLTIPRDRLEGGVEKMIALYDTHGTLVTSRIPQHMALPALQYADVAKPHRDSMSRATVPTLALEPTGSVATPKEYVPVPEETAPHTTDLTERQLAAAARTDTPSTVLPYVGLAAVIVLGLMALYTQQRVS